MKRFIRILPIVALLFVSISRMWWRSIGTVAARTIGGQQSTVTAQYTYDDNGRLTRVYLPTSDQMVVYSYDAAGNISSILRLGALQVISFSPPNGRVGSSVTFLGTGFAAGVTSVSFNGALSSTFQASPPNLTATVPEGATTGPVTITTPNGSVTTATPFALIGS